MTVVAIAAQSSDAPMLNTVCFISCILDGGPSWQSTGSTSFAGSLPLSGYVKLPACSLFGQVVFVPALGKFVYEAGGNVEQIGKFQLNSLGKVRPSLPAP